MLQRKWIYLNIPLNITVKGPLHIGTGYDRGLVQRTVARERVVIAKRPGSFRDAIAHHTYIPGSSLKGKVRNACEDLVRHAGLESCGAPLPNLMCGRDRESYCLVCRIFGSPGGNVPDGRELVWQDAHLSDASRRATSVDGRPLLQTMQRTQVQLSRSRGMAAEDRLYTSEFTTPGLNFAGRVSGWVEATRSSVECGFYESNLLLAGLRMVEMLGGGRSRGAGRCRIELPTEVTLLVEGQKEPEIYPVEELLSAAISLGLYTEEEGAANART